MTINELNHISDGSHRVVLVTGASSGIGRAAAESFNNAGYITYGTTRNLKSDFAAEASNLGIKMLELDVCDEAGCQNTVRTIIEAEGRIDILYNNAGNGIAGAVEMTDVNEMKDQFETNFFGALRLTNMVLPYMRKQKSGRIIYSSSVAAFIPIPYQAFYCASKAALESVSQALGIETSGYNIKCICIEFGDTKTRFTGNRRISAGTQSDNAESGSHIYTEKYISSLNRMEQDEINGKLPESYAGFILKTARKRNPKPVVICGFTYRLVMLMRRLMPLCFTNWIIGKLYG